ncbi:MAG: ATP-dependent DNA ligase [Streptosporangiales bacterium]|nr:ATP-dependent DNA ligase [Streptosporangiales bacterium]
MSTERVRVGGIAVELSKTDKILFPDDKIAKGELVSYYRDIAGRMLPYLRGRPLAMLRQPDGITGERIFQKNVPEYFPDWITRVRVEKEDGALQQVVCDRAATLVYLANQACIEPHVFLSRTDRLDHPDHMVFDLDPPDERHFDAARWGALLLREFLEDELGLVPFVKTSGGKGLHVHVPLDRRTDFDTVRGIARAVAELLADRHPDRLTTEQRKDKRGERLFVDYLRNAYAQTVVAPYSVRARPAAPVATPLHWDEVEDDRLRPDAFTLRTLPKRLEHTSDPWAG